MSIIPLATHPVAASTLSATVPTTPFAISPPLSITDHAISHSHPASPQIAHPAPFTASIAHPATHHAASTAPLATDHAASVAPFATLPAASTAPLATDHAASAAPFTAQVAVLAAFPARSAAHQTTPHARSVAPFATSQIPPATHHATAQAFHILHFRNHSNEKSPPHKNAAIADHIRVIRSLGSIDHPSAFHAKIIMINHSTPASLVLYHKSSHAPARISQIVAIHHRALFGKKSKNHSNPGAAAHNCDISPPNLPNHASNNNKPAITRITHKIFQYIIYNN